MSQRAWIPVVFWFSPESRAPRDIEKHLVVPERLLHIFSKIDISTQWNRNGHLEYKMTLLFGMQ